MLKKLLLFIVVGATVFFAYGYVQNHSQSISLPISVNLTNSFNAQAHSQDQPDSVWVVVNKTRQLAPKEYQPKGLVTPKVPLRVPGNESMQLRSDAAGALQDMFAAANREGIKLMLSSGYRSYTYQVGLYNEYVAVQGKAKADKESARPGYSEHQTGLAVDVEPLSRTCELKQCFANTNTGKWVAINAYKYGFIVRYPKDKTEITGYSYEPWHLRYVGTDLSNEMHKQNILTLEEFFKLGPAPDYRAN